MEAPRAYKCKQILGLLHLPPRLEDYRGSRKSKNLGEEKNPNMSQTCRKTLCVRVKIASLVLCVTCIFIYAVLFSVSACGEGDL